VRDAVNGGVVPAACSAGTTTGPPPAKSPFPVGFVVTGKDQHDVMTPDQPAAAAGQVNRWSGAERIDERVGQRGDHIGLLGQFSADRRGCPVANHADTRAFAHQAEALL